MTSLRFHTAGLAAALACGFGTAAMAGTYDSVYVFGDSLSDIGRVSALTGGTFPGPSADPTLNYVAGRFSNGPVAVETMTKLLTGSALTLDHDYAVGGARTGVSPISNSDNNTAALNGTGLQNQVALFRSNVGVGAADPNALYVVWAGANDFSEAGVLTNFDNQQWNRVIGNVESAIGTLAANGAKHFFVPNMPNLGMTPAILSFGQGVASGVSQLVGLYNAQLSQSLSAFDAANTSFDIKQFDTYGLMATVAADVAAHGSYQGVSNLTVPCQTDPLCANNPTLASQAFFWDTEHPTAAVHQILGTAFAQAAAVPEPETYALMLAGLTIVGWMARRRAARP